MKRKGFTLIELLAAIVVLAVIAFIATPLVLNTIEDAKRGSFEQTVTNVVKASNLYQARQNMNDELNECRYFSFGNNVDEITIRDNKKYYPLSELELKGDLPTEGEVEICIDDIILEASNGLYSGNYDGKNMNIGKGDLASNDLKQPVIDTFNTTASTNKIIVTIVAHSQSVGGVISNYYYKIDDGDYIKTTENGYIFEGLEANTEYKITIKVENKSGVTTQDYKTVTTKAFGEIVVSVENENEWTSSKEVTLSGGTDEYAIEYKINKYNEETLELEEGELTTYKAPFTLNTMATTEYPTRIAARYNDNGYYSEYKTHIITKIDTSAPTNTSPTVNASTTKPTSEASVILRQSDNESDIASVKYGISTSATGTYTYQTSATFTGLAAGTTYYFKTQSTNGAGTTTTSSYVSYTPGKGSGTCSVSASPSGYATSKTITVSSSNAPAGTTLQYKIGSSETWTEITSGNTFTLTENAIVYCRLYDGVSTVASGNTTVTKIDTTGPTTASPSATAVSTAPTSQVTITNNQTDAESDIASVKYGMATSAAGTYTYQTSATFTGLTAGTTYYFKTQSTNGAGTTTTSSYVSYTPGKGSGTCSVSASPSGYATSKTITVSSSNAPAGTTLQYKIGSSGTWAAITSGNTFTLTENAIVYCRLYDGVSTVSSANTTVSGIDTTGPSTTKPSATAVSTAPTSQVTITNNQTDAESDIASVKYGMATSAAGTYTYQTSATFTGLTAGTTYYFKTQSTNGAGTTTTSEYTSYTPSKSGSCTVSQDTTSWTTSKIITVTSSNAPAGTTLQYKIGSSGTWTEITSGNTFTLTENTIVYCRLYDGVSTVASGNTTVTKIDTTVPSLTLGTVTSTTSSIIIPFTAADNESGIKSTTCVYGTSTSYGTSGTVSGSECIISGLTAGTTYYYKLVTTNNSGLTAERPGTTASGSISVTFKITQDPSGTTYAQSKAVTVTYTTNNVTNPTYYVKTTVATTSSATGYACGTGATPSSCTSLSTFELNANTWYKVESTPTVTFKANGTIYGMIHDGDDYLTASTLAVSNIDTTVPSLTLGTVTSTTSSIIIPFTAADSESGIKNTTCAYGTDGTLGYDSTGTVSGSNCIISDLKAGTTYKYKLVTTDNIGNTKAASGSATTKSITNPSITFTNKPTTAVNGYLTSQVANVTYSSTGITSPRYFVKTSRAGTSSLSVTKSCGTGTEPSTSCTTITSTKSLAANTWYEVSGNVNVTYNTYSSTTGTIYAITYDGTNFSSAATGTISKITKSVTYTVKHYTMNTDMSTYFLAYAESLTGNAGYTVTPSVKTYTGFASPSTQTVTLAADGSTVVEYKYTRKQVTVTFYQNLSSSDTSTASQTFTYGVSGNKFGYNTDGSSKWGTSGQFGIWDKAGYQLLGWAESSTATSQTYSTYSEVADSWIDSKVSGATGTVKLYAVWKAKVVTVIFNKNDGSGGTASQTFTYGVSGNKFGYNTDGTSKWGTSGQFGAWDRSGYTLLGWSESSTATSQTYSTYSGIADSWIDGKTSDSTGTGTVNLYAVWKKN